MQLLDWTEATRKLDRLLHDAWVRADRREPPTDVVIAAIDEASLAELGRWPWSRDLQGVVVGELARRGARAVVVDVVHAEPADDPGSDVLLAGSLASLPAVLPVLLEARPGRAPVDRLPVPVIARAADALGHVALPIDDDGIVRRAHLKAGIGRAHWPTLALAAHETLGAAAARDPPGARSTPPSEGSRGRLVRDHEVLIPFYGPPGTFERVSIASLLDGSAPPGAIAGRTVLLGLTANGLGDAVPAPVSALDRPLPGIEVHATLYAALADGSLVTAAPRWTGLVVAALLLPVLLLAYSRAPPGLGLAVALTGAVLPVAVSATLHAARDLWYPPVAAGIAALASWLFWSRHRLSFVNRFLEAERARLELQLPRRDGDVDERLASFFEQAARHLPIRGWRMKAGGRRFAGGAPVPTPAFDKSATHWRAGRGIWSRRYRVPGGLEIALHVDDPGLAAGFTRYVDSLSRVRSRRRPSLFGDTVERLQSNAFGLSGQLDRLASVKTFSETLLAEAPIGYAVWTPAGEVVRVNPRVERLVPGLAAPFALADFLAALGHDPATDAEARARLDALLLAGEPWQIVRERAEQEIVVDLSAVGATLAERLVCASVVDVSEIRGVERARAELVDYLSHDLRSPLISALYLVEGEGARAPARGAGAVAAPAAADRPPGAPPDGDRRRDEDGRRIAANIRRSLAMMDDLLHVARADALEAASFAEVLLDGVVDNAIDQMLPQARGRGVRLALEIAADDELWVRGDASSLERAVANIVGNAIKYSHDGGPVRVSLTREPGGAGAPDRALLAVVDEGVGIDPDVIDTLFVRFRRDARVADSHQGIGLGLALVARVVSQHGGEVDASSAGDGTEIRVRLPLLEDV